MLAGFLCASLLASPPTPAQSPTLAQLDQRRFEIHVLPRIGARLLDTTAVGELGGSIQLGLGVRIWRGLMFEVELGEGVYAPPVQLSGQILAGLRWELRRSARVRPSLYAGFTHLHQSHGEHFVHEPAPTLLGTSKSINHRSGVQLGFGLRFPFPVTWGKHAPRFSGLVRTDAAYYFDDAPGRVQVGLSFGFGVVF